MELYKREHGQHFRLPQEITDLVTQGKLIDHSWHNDVCPRFDSDVAPPWKVLWVDEEDPAHREAGPDQARYVVQQFDEDDDWVADLLVTDDLQAAIQCVLEGA